MALAVRVDGQLVFNTITLRMNAALAGLGLAYLPEDQGAGSPCRSPLGSGAGRLVSAVFRLSPLLPEPPPATPAFAVLAAALRYRG
jgi:hypothetical protein